MDLNCHFYVVEAILENKCMYFQDYDYAVPKCTEKMYQASLAVLTDLENELNRSKSNRKREYAARTQFDCSNEER